MQHRCKNENIIKLSITVSLLGQGKGYTVKCSSLPEGRPKEKGLYLTVVEFYHFHEYLETILLQPSKTLDLKKLFLLDLLKVLIIFKCFFLKVF